MNPSLDALKSDSRQEALKALSILNETSTPHLDRLVQVAAETLRCNAAAISLITRSTQVVKAQFGTLPWGGDSVFNFSRSFCPYVAAGDEKWVVADSDEHPLVREGTITGMFGRSYIGVPLRAPGGTTLGVFMVSDRSPRLWSIHEVRALESFAGLVEHEFALLLRGAQWSHVEKELEETRRAWFTLLGNLPGMVYRCTKRPDFWDMEFVSEGARELTGYAPFELQGNRMLTYALLVNREDHERIWSEVERALLSRSPYRFTYRITTPEGVEKWVWEQGEGVYGPHGEVIAIEGFVTDISEQKRNEELLARQADEMRALSLADELTGLHNRRSFMQLASQQLRLAQRGNRDIAMVFVDLDGMKDINDTLGHAMGDLALRETADLLRAVCRTSDVVARLGGDEFVVLTVNPGPSGPELLRERIESRLREINSETGRAFELALSVGITRPQSDEEFDIHVLMELADVAMYEQKQAKRGAHGRSTTKIHAQPSEE